MKMANLRHKKGYRFQLGFECRFKLAASEIKLAQIAFSKRSGQ